MKRVLASIGLGAVIVGGLISPAIAEDTPQIHAEITKATSASRQVSSEINVSGTWTVEKLAVGQSSVSNHAEVNGLKLEATTTLKSNGGTDGDGSNKPKPTPAPTPEPTPSPNPTTPAPTPSPKPSEPTPAPKPSEKPTPIPTTPTPKPSVTTPAPKPSATTPAPKQPVAKENPKTSEQPKLAKTGSSALFAGILATVLALFGVGLYKISRKDNN